MDTKDFDLDIKKIPDDKSGTEARTITPTATIAFTILNKCKSVIPPTTGMTQGCCHNNVLEKEAKEDIRMLCQ